MSNRSKLVAIFFICNYQQQSSMSQTCSLLYATPSDRFWIQDGEIFRPNPPVSPPQGAFCKISSDNFHAISLRRLSLPAPPMVVHL